MCEMEEGVAAGCVLFYFRGETLYPTLRRNAKDGEPGDSHPTEHPPTSEDPAVGHPGCHRKFTSPT